jgi:hypothetical protein
MKEVGPLIDATVVPGANAPTPAVTSRVIPATSPVVEPTVITVLALVAPAVEVYTGPSPKYVTTREGIGAVVAVLVAV